MKLTNQCPKCASKDLVRNAELPLESAGTHLELATYRKPDAVIFREKQTSGVTAWICSACGYVELYAKAPTNLQIPSSIAPKA
jgi:predicted nucleic-acid-binding Zn-ribbon protein